MDLSEDKKHIILLAIISVLFVLLATGLALQRHLLKQQFSPRKVM